MDPTLEKVLKKYQAISKNMMDLADIKPPIPLPPIKTYKIQGSGNNIYTISKRGSTVDCSCPGFVYRRKCKHISAFLYSWKRQYLSKNDIQEPFKIKDLSSKNCGFQKKKVEKKINKINDLQGYLTYPWKCGIIMFETEI